MTHLALRPQPLGIFPLPAGFLALPPAAGADAALPELLRGRLPAELPAPWRFFALAHAGDSAGALAALAGDQSPEARYNRLVLGGDPDTYAALRAELTGDLALLLGVTAYTLGLTDVPPAPGAATGELRAFALMARAAHALEHGAPGAAEAELVDAIAAAAPGSPLLAGQLHLTLAETRVGRLGPEPLAIQHYREAIRLLTGSGLEETRAHANLSLGMLYQELARDQRGPLLEAAKCYQEALRTFSRAAYPELFALAQNNLALAYLAMPLTEASDQLRMGIAVQALREALTVYTRASHPERWGSAQLNLANALQYLPSARPEEHLAEAVELYEALLAARDSDADPLGYGRVLANQGNALAHLGIFNHARPKLQEAARLFAAGGDHEAAATVRELLGGIEQSVAEQKEDRRDGGVPAPAV
jgi:tetratricopeptide (TPR) repeat protein